MAKLGLLKHRRIVAISSGLFLAGAIFSLIFSIVEGDFTNWWATVMYLSVGGLGIYALIKQKGLLMKIYGGILVFFVAIEVLAIVGIFILIFTREAAIKLVLKEYMDLYDSHDIREIIDTIQTDLRCCGLQTHNDWTKVPSSCCVNTACSNYYQSGCVEKISTFALYGLIVYEIVLVGFTILHVFTFKAAFALAKAFILGPQQFVNRVIFSHT